MEKQKIKIGRYIGELSIVILGVLERYKEWIVFMNDAEFYFERSKEQIIKVLTYKF